MIEVRLEVSVQEEIAQGIPNGKWLWDRLAKRGKLPRVPHRNPHTEMLAWWGRLPDGVLFVRHLVRTEEGFTCQVNLYPDRGIYQPSQKTADPPLIGWIKENLFLGRPGETIEEDGVWRFLALGDQGIEFTLGGLPRNPVSRT